jgi:hypothetical protein
VRPLFHFCIKSPAAVSSSMASTTVIPPTSDNTHHQPEGHQSSHSHSHHAPKTMMQTATAPRSVELPPPAWGSPAHLAARRAEKEWTQHLRAHASADAAARKIGKHARYVDGVDIVIRYSLPPDWSLAGDNSENTKSAAREGDAIWELPESDELLVAVLKASSQPFFQRTGEFSKVRRVLFYWLNRKVLNFRWCSPRLRSRLRRLQNRSCTRRLLHPQSQ